MRDTIMVYDTGNEFDYCPALAELIGFASIHLVSLSTMTRRYFFFLAPL